VPRGLLPALTIVACAAALLPAVPASAADEPVVTTITRDGASLQFRRATTTVKWPMEPATTLTPGTARFDLDGDGVDELILGNEVYDSGSSPDKDSGVLLIRYADGRTERLTKTGTYGLARMIAVGDFNGDHFGDVAVSDGAALWVLSGSSTGLVAESAVRLTSTSEGMPSGASLSGLFAVGDLDGDGHDDLAIGNHTATVGTAKRAGAVTVLRGAASGLGAAGGLRLTQATDGVPGTPAESVYFGASVAIGDVTGDAHLDLVVGATGDGQETGPDPDSPSGSVTVLPGTTTGPTGTGATTVIGKVLDHVALHVRDFGASVSVGELTGDGRADVLAGASQSTLAGRQLSGVAVVLHGSPTGIAASRRSIWHQDSADVAGTADGFDMFSRSTTAGDFTGDGRPDLVLGSPWAKVGTQSDAGKSTMLLNSPGGLTGVGSSELTGVGSRLHAYFVHATELTGGGTQEVLIGGQRELKLYRTAEGKAAPVAVISRSTLGATDVQIYDLGTSSRFPVGVPLAVPAAGDIPAAPAPVLKKPRSRFDFDGDGRDEVVVGNAEGAIIRYSASGRTDELVPQPRYVGNSMSFAAGDFNGDGYADLAAGDRYDHSDNAAIDGQGGIWICLGSPNGLAYDSCRHLTQNSSGIPGTSGANDGFGDAVAAGDLNGDGRDDLAIGTPDEKIGKATSAGAVIVLFGTPTGITTTGAIYLHQNMPWIPDTSELDDRFGGVLAIGDVTGDKRADLAISSVGENGGLGSVTLIKGAAGGLLQKAATTVQYKDLKQRNQWGAAFGTSLVVSDFNRDGRAELAAGAPEAALTAKTGGGQVIVFKGLATGISRSSFTRVHEDVANVPGAAKIGDAFGTSLAAGDISGDGHPDLLVGAPNETVGKDWAAGTVTVLKGGKTGLTGTGSQTFNQDNSTVPDAAEEFDRFGAAVSILNLDGTGGLDALVSADYENIGTAPEGSNAGSVTEFAGRSGKLVPTVSWNGISLQSTYQGFALNGRYLGGRMLAS
jgi:hypothetical protein